MKINELIFVKHDCDYMDLGSLVPALCLTCDCWKNWNWEIPDASLANMDASPATFLVHVASTTFIYLCPTAEEPSLSIG